MTRQPDIYLNLFWHQHQPWYLDPETKISVMPWVRLHGIKDYYDISHLCRRFEGWKQTVNLVPSLLEQLILYTEGRANDSFLSLSQKPASELNQKEKENILTNFFAGFHPQMIQPHPRYDELFRKRGKDYKKTANVFTTQDFLDLQVWHNLVWIDPIWLDDPNLPLKDLIHKQRNFTEEDKQEVLAIQEDILKKIIPLHRDLHQDGLLEITTSPFYHPILPLLCDSAIASVSNPEDPTPKPPFQYPSDAEWHIRAGLDYFEQTMGFRPQGMWPSEGSVSDEACALMKKAGIGYFATDEAILYRSQFVSAQDAHRPETLLKLHRLHTAEGEIDCIFRNHALSDRIGFVYRSWDAKDAANDFIQQIKEIGAGWHEPVPPLVNVILDGENCWEFYPRDGNDFLNYLIEGILNEPQIHPTTVPEFREQFPPSPSLHSIFPGSWINNNFRIWVGHQEDNAAWHFLRQAREDLAKHEQNVEESIRQEAWKLLYIAQGSDWFWWYGDDHQSDYGDVFDALFRNHIKRVYTLLGLEPPEALKRPIPQPMITQKGGGILFKEPDVSTPVKRYYDWVGAKKLEVKSGGGAMHQATDVEAELRYGRFDNHLCFTIKLKNSDLLNRNPAISVHVTKPIIKTLPVFPAGKAGKGNLHDHRFEGVVEFDPSEISSQQELWFFIQIDVEGEPKVTLPSGTELYLQGYTHANACIYWFA